MVYLSIWNIMFGILDLGFSFLITALKILKNYRFMIKSLVFLGFNVYGLEFIQKFRVLEFRIYDSGSIQWFMI